MKFILIVITTMFLALSQAMLKLGMIEAKNHLGDEYSLIMLIFRTLKSHFTWAALFATGVASIAWFFVLSKSEFSQVYPMIALSYVFGLILGRLLLGETITVYKVIGTLLISSGVIVLSKLR